MEELCFSFKTAKFNHDYKEGVKTTVQKALSYTISIPFPATAPIFPDPARIIFAFPF